MNTLGFIGVGNMGSAMVRPIAEDKEKFIYIYDENKQVYTTFKQENIAPVEELSYLVEHSKYIVLTIKPIYYESVCKSIKPYLTKEHIVITVAPGITIQKMKELLGEETKIVRTMPNTPALVGCGVTAYCYEKGEVSESAIDYLKGCFESFGAHYHVDEHQMDAIVPTTGSSPAYAYMFIEAMGDAAVRFGLPRQMAYEMAALTLKGAAEMVLQTKMHPGVLKDAVTSPAGTTIEAVAKLEETGFRNSVMSSMTACYEKTKMMSK